MREHGAMIKQKEFQCLNISMVTYTMVNGIMINQMVTECILTIKIARIKGIL